MLLLATAACSGQSTVAPRQTRTPSASPSTVSPAASPAPVSPSPAAVSSPTPLALSRCTTGQLRLVVRQGDSGAGQSHQPLVLTNRGGRCSLNGYPGVSFVDAAGRLLGSPAAETGEAVRRVVLAPGAAVVAVLAYSNAGAYPDSSCRPQQADRVRVYPPGDRVALLAADPVLVCSAPGSGQLHIGPVTVS